MATRKKKASRKSSTARATKASPKRKWWRLGAGALARSLVSEQAIQRIPLDLLRAEVSRHLKKITSRSDGFVVTETRYANVPFFITTYVDPFHREAYELMKQRGAPAAERDQMLPETIIDLGTFHQGLRNAL